MEEKNNLNYSDNTTDTVGQSNETLKQEVGERNKNSAGPMAGLIIIIIIIILGGFYVLRKVSNEDAVLRNGDEIRQEEDNATLDLQTQNNSDEISDIESDLSDTELNGLDAELESIGTEFNF